MAAEWWIPHSAPNDQGEVTLSAAKGLLLRMATTDPVAFLHL
jgi:hypothetical protein